MGEQGLSSRHLVRLFFSTLILGGIVAGIVGALARWNEQFQPLIQSADYVEMLMTFIWLVGVGFIFSVISQMGFFAYLTVHRLGLGIFKSLWNPVQIVLILFVLFDLVYLRYISFGSNDSIISYLLVAGIVVVIGLPVAYIKMKQTNKHAFVPALFFMIVITTIELVPVLRQDDISWVYYMLIPLLACNAYQLLILHKLNQKSAIELEKKKSTRAQLKVRKA